MAIENIFIGFSKTNYDIWTKIIKMPNSNQEPPESSKAPRKIKGHGCYLHLQNQHWQPNV